MPGRKAEYRQTSPQKSDAIGYKMVELKFEKFPIRIICLWASVLVIIVAIATIAIEKGYLEHHSYFFDSVYYSFYNAVLYTRLADENRFSLALEEWLINPRFPLRTLPLILIAPRLLGNQMGYIATALPMLFIFLVLLGWTIYRRNGYLPYGLACMALFCSQPIIFDPRYGLGAYWLDLPASFLVASSGLCLFNSSGARSLKWLVGFAALISLAALSREISIGFSFAIYAPILSYYLLQRWRKERNFIKSVCLPLGAIATTIGMLAGYFIISHLQENLYFHTTFRYSAGHDFIISAKYVLPTLANLAFANKSWVVILAIAATINLAACWKNKNQHWEDLLVSFWAAIAVPLFLIFVVGAKDRHPILYALPFPFLFAVSPRPLIPKQSYRPWAKVLSAAIVTSALVLGGQIALQNYQVAIHASPQEQQLKSLDISLARELIKEEKPVIWNAYFDVYSWIPSMEAFFRHGKFPLPAGEDNFFTIHESTWKGTFPNLTAEEMARKSYENTNKWVDVAVVFDNPAAADKHFDGEYTRTVAHYIAQTINQDKRWIKTFTLESEFYGKLVGYRNSQAVKNNYQRRLKDTL
jgi:hypothetical protein